MKISNSYIKKLVSKIFLISIISTLLQPIFPLIVEAAISFKIPIGIKTADEKNAGSDGELYAYLIDWDDMPTKNDIETPNYDDLERGDYKVYNTSFNNAPWMLRKIRFYFDDDNGWLLSYIDVNVPKLQNNVIWKTFSFQGNWMGSDSGNKESITWDISSNTKRNITSNTLSSMGGTILFSESEADNFFGPKSSTNKEWGSYFKWDLKIEDQYGNYYPNDKLYENADKPGEVKLDADSRYKNAEDNVSNPDYLFKLDPNLKLITFQPYPQIWDTMKSIGTDTATFNFKWKFLARSTNTNTNNNEIISTITLKRKVFYLNRDDISIKSGSYQKISEDNNFFNLSNQKIVIYSELSNNINASNTVLAENFTGRAFLLKGNYDAYERDSNNNIIYKTEDKICDLSYSSSNGLLTFEGNIPTNYTTDKKGLSLVVEDVSSSGGYTVEERQQDDSLVAGSVHKYFSSYNVDTISPTFNIVDNDELNSWSQTHSFYVTSSEEMKGGLANYRLYNESNQPVNITNYSGSGNVNSVQTIPITTSIIAGAKLNLKLSDRIEGKFTFKIDGQDSANNYGSKTLGDIWIDNKAPTANINVTYNERATDNSKRADINFGINDLSGTGRVYYCFLDDYIIPAKGSQAWKFVEQGGDSTTASIKVEEGEDFVGRLYYYTADGSGNDSYDSVKNNYINVSLYNKNVTGYMVIEDMTPGKSRYDIRFEKNGSFNELKYRWIDKNVPKTGFVQDYIYYALGNDGKYPDIGAATQKGIDGREYILDGTYELECIVYDIYSGNEMKYTYTLVFDNSNPTIELPEWSNGTRIRDSQQAAIKISDIGSISYASYQIVDLYNNPIGVEVPLPINNTGTVNTLVNIEVPEEVSSGIYGIRIYAKDAKGNFTTVGYNYLEGTEGKLIKRDSSYYNNTAMRFAIRKDKPILELVSASGYPIVSSASNIEPNRFITGKSTYTITLRAREIMKNIDRFSYSTYIKYQVSPDGINWSNWRAAGRMINETDSSFMEFTLNTPYALSSKEFKDIYIRVACYNDTSELNITPDEKYISSPVAVSFKFDNSLADYDIAYDINEKTNKNVIGILTIHSDLGKNYNITSDDPNISITSRDKNSAVIVISNSVNTEIQIEDNFGNITEVPIEVDWIDKDAPVAVVNNKNIIDSGARKDADINITIKDTLPNTTKFALMKSGGTPTEEDFNLFDRLRVEGRIKINTISSEKKYGEFDETYNITIKGIDGDYCLGYYSEDTIKNSISTSIIGSDMTLEDSEIEFIGASYSPANAQYSTVATLKFNVPVAILPEDMLSYNVQENLDRAEQYGRSKDTKFSDEHKFVYEELSDKTYYVCDETGRVKQISFSIEGVVFNEGFEHKVSYVLNGTPISFIDGLWMTDDLDVPVMINDGKSIGIEEDGELKIYVSPAYPNQYFYILPNDKLNGIKINESLSTIVSRSAITASGVILEDVSEDDEDVINIYSDIVFDVLANGDSFKEVKYYSYIINETAEKITQNEVIAMNNVDDTPPDVTWVLSNSNPTNKPVNVYIYFKDVESGIAKVEEKDYDGNFVEVSSAEYSGSNQIIFILNNNDEVKDIRVTNKAGLVTTIDNICAPNIDKLDIEFGVHYKVEYSYENYNGDWISIDDISNESYYRILKATIVPEHGISKKLYIDNNKKSFEKILANYIRSYTFDIMDTSGNEATKTVSYDKFDIEGPIIKYNFNPSAEIKTNKPITITIIENDDIVKCELYYLDDNEPLIIDENDGEFTSTIDKNGSYAIYAWDYLGNKSTELFEVTNVDNSAVEMTKVIFQTPEITYRLISNRSDFEFSTPGDMITGQTVDVIIESFNKSNVKINQVVPLEETGLIWSDIVYSMSSKSIRFKKNGSIAVSFVDEYGNEGIEIITVNCIKTTPPQCKGVFTIAPNQAYATITFESMLDSSKPLEKDLSKIYVVSGILNSNAVVTAAEAKIMVNENRTYSFILSDAVGNTQNISVSVTGIDKVPPKVTAVDWNYDYLSENSSTGEWNTLNETGRDEAPPQDGYTLSPDNKPETNQDVKVTVTTDKDIIQIGSFDDTAKREITFIYHENGVFSFNLEAINETSVIYGVNVQLIDKNKPIIQFDNTKELIFIEGDTREASKYDISMLYDFTAYDMRNGEPIEIPKDKVKIDFGGFNPNDISKNKFNRNSPYYIKYKVTDSVGNITEATRTIRLISFNDTIALINDIMPNSSNMVAIDGDEFTVTMKNHSGKTYVKYSKGLYTMGEMKYKGEGVEANSNGAFVIKVKENGWYTVSIQTDKKDFFNIHIYMNVEGVKSTEGGTK